MAENPRRDLANGETWTVRRILDWTTQHLEKHGSETPRLDAEILLAHARGCGRIELYTRYAEPLTDAHRAIMRDLVKRRANSEPVAYLVGHREFFSLDFRVTPDVLIPRPDTETLVLELLDIAKPLTSPRILEIGTGSGCIAITAAVHLPNADITATDISPAALDIARQNAKTHGVHNRIEWRQGDLFAPLPSDSQFDVIVSNPPYIREDELPTLQRDVGFHEPELALVAGPDGLSVIRRIVEQANVYLRAGGTLMMEIACEQSTVVQDLLNNNDGFDSVRMVNDLTGRPRVAIASGIHQG
ncbi:MAG: peptide chain release factor N(5)-glutamine methyltransferase [Planctomycetaceae bacterium]